MYIDCEFERMRTTLESKWSPEEISFWLFNKKTVTMTDGD